MPPEYGFETPITVRAMPNGPISALAKLPDVSEAVARAEKAISRVTDLVAGRRISPSPELVLRAGHANLALQGVSVELSDMSAGLIADPLVHNVIRLYETLPTLVRMWGTVPLQVLAKLHLLSGTGLLPEQELGRPVSQSLVVLHDLAGLLVNRNRSTDVLLAAIVHAQLVTSEAFGSLSTMVAAAAARLTLALEVDPSFLVLTEVGHLARLPEYHGSLGAYTTGRVDGVRSWLKHYCAAIEIGASEGMTILSKLSTSD
jgi:hypothetical protein